MNEGIKEEATISGPSTSREPTNQEREKHQKT